MYVKVNYKVHKYLVKENYRIKTSVKRLVRIFHVRYFLNKWEMFILEQILLKNTLESRVVIIPPLQIKYAKICIFQ